MHLQAARESPADFIYFLQHILFTLVFLLCSYLQFQRQWIVFVVTQNYAFKRTICEVVTCPPVCVPHLYKVPDIPKPHLWGAGGNKTVFYLKKYLLRRLGEVARFDSYVNMCFTLPGSHIHLFSSQVVCLNQDSDTSK